MLAGFDSRCACLGRRSRGCAVRSKTGGKEDCSRHHHCYCRYKDHYHFRSHHGLSNRMHDDGMSSTWRTCSVLP